MGHRVHLTGARDYRTDALPWARTVIAGRCLTGWHPSDRNVLIDDLLSTTSNLHGKRLSASTVGGLAERHPVKHRQRSIERFTLNR